MWCGRLAEAEHHRRRRAQPQRVPLAHHLHPGVGRALERRDRVADLVVEDLGAAARDRIEPGRDQPLDDRADRHVLELGDVADLLGRQAVDRQREVGLHPAEQIFVPGERQVGVQPALQQDLHAAEVDRLLELLRQHLARERVALFAGRRPVEVAELAARDADVGVVDVAIDDVRDDAFGVQRAPARVRRRARGPAPAPARRGESHRRATAAIARRRVGQQRVQRLAGVRRPCAPRRQRAGVRGGRRPPPALPLEEAHAHRARRPRRPRACGRRTPPARTAPRRPGDSGCCRSGSARRAPAARRAPRPRRDAISRRWARPSARLRCRSATSASSSASFAPGPERVDERQSGHAPPLLAEVDDVLARGRRREAGVADHQRAGRAGRRGERPRRAAPRGSAA